MTRRIALEDMRPGDELPPGEETSSPDHVITERPPPMDPADALLGRVVAGRYRISKVRGRGGMGVVFEGEHLELQKPVAIKVLVASYARDAEALARFEREARTAAKLGHANIVATLDLGRLDTGEPFLVMEFVAGEDLVELVRAAGRGELPTERMLRVLDQIAAALDAIHEAGIVHRDIKAENVLLVAAPGGREIVKVVDFGLATLADAERRGARLTREGMVIGTPEYLAPECVRGALGGPAADRYALGVLAFELSCGSPPFESPVPMDVMLAKLTTDAPLLSSVTGRRSPALDAVLARALARDPEARHGSCAELVASLRTAIAADAATGGATHDGGTEPPIPMRSPPYRAILGGVALLALLGAGAAGWSALAPRTSATAETPAPWSAPAPVVPAPVPVVPPPSLATEVPAPAPTEPTTSLVPHVTRPAVRDSRPGPATEPTLATSPPPPASEQVPEPPRPPPTAAPATEPREPPTRTDPILDRGAAAGDLVRSAQASLLRGQVAEARDLFRDATRISPRHAPAWRGLGIASEQLHEAPEARRAFERYLELAPDAADATAVRGRLTRLGG